METVLSFLCAHATYAHLVIFGLLLLAGLNVPLSEDLLVMAGGMLAGTCVPQNNDTILLWLLLGCILSAYESYWIGRCFGKRLYSLPLFRSIINPQRVEKAGQFFERYGLGAFVVVRFIPLGVRNCFFMTCGLSRMPFMRFAWRDAIGAILSCYVLFTLGRVFGENYHLLVEYFHQYEIAVFGLIILVVVAIALFVRCKKGCSMAATVDHEVK